MLDTPIIVSDEKYAGFDDYIYHNGIIERVTYRDCVTEMYSIYPNGRTPMCQHRDSKLWDKIIAGLPELPQIDFSALSEEDCNRIGFIDVEKLAVKESIKDKAEALIYNQLSESPKEDNDFCAEISKDFWVSGFQAAQKLNEKKFSLKELEWAFMRGALINQRTHNGETLSFSEERNKDIQSLHQPKIFDIEVEMDFVHTDHVLGGFEYFPKITNNRVKITKIL